MKAFGRFRFLGRLLREFVGFAKAHKRYWLLPLLLILLLLGAAMAVSAAASPFIYTLF